MKQLLLALLLLSTCLVIGQDDSNWYIKNGIIQDPYALTTSPIQATDEIKISGINPSSTTTNQNQIDRNFFMLDSSGNHHFSRSLAGSPNWNYDNDFLYLKSSSPILYLYTTYIYDDDPPDPADINVVNDISTTANVLAQTLGGIEYNQDIVYYDDLILAVKNPSTNFTLDFSEIILPNGNRERLSNSIEGSNQFNQTFATSKSYILNNTANIPVTINNNGQIIVDPIGSGNPYIYFCVKATEALINTYKQKRDTINKLHIRMFTDSSNKATDSLQIAIRNSHDPNLLSLKSICKDACGDLFFKYSCTFRNNSAFPANNLAVKLTLPLYLDGTEVKVIDNSYLVNGEPMTKDINVSIDGRGVFFNLKDISIKCSNPSKDNEEVECGRVRFDFCVKVKDEFVDNILSEESFYIEGETIFDQGEGKTETIYPLIYQDRTCQKKILSRLEKKDLSCKREIIECDECGYQLCIFDWKWWYWIVILGLLAALGIFIYKKSEKNKHK